MQFKYKLSQEEMEEALLSMDWRREGKYKLVNLCIISVIGAAVLLSYIKHPEQFFLFILLISILFLLFYLVYGREKGRRNRARKIVAKKGEYRLEIKDDVLIYGEKEEKIKMLEEKIQIIFSQNICVIRIADKVFVIPVRLLSVEDMEQLKKIARTGANSLVHVVMEKE